MVGRSQLVTDSLMYGRGVLRTDHTDGFLHTDGCLLKEDLLCSFWRYVKCSLTKKRDSCLHPFSCFEFKNKEHPQC